MIAISLAELDHTRVFVLCGRLKELGNSVESNRRVSIELLQLLGSIELSHAKHFSEGTRTPIEEPRR